MDRLRNFGFLLKSVSHLYVKRFEQKSLELGMTLPQCKALAYLFKHEGISQTRLAELADIDPMSLVRILDRMEADGWVERGPDPADRRARRLRVRTKAKPVLERIWRLADTVREDAFTGITQRERGRLMTLLERIQGNLASLDGTPPAKEKPLQSPQVLPGAAKTAKSRSSVHRTGKR